MSSVQFDQISCANTVQLSLVCTMDFTFHSFVLKFIITVTQFMSHLMGLEAQQLLSRAVFVLVRECFRSVLTEV